MKEYHKIQNKLFFQFTLVLSVLIIPLLIIYFFQSNLSTKIIVLFSANTLVMIIFLAIHVSQLMLSGAYIKKYGGTRISKAYGPSYFVGWLLLLLLLLLWIQMFISKETFNTVVYLPLVYSIGVYNHYIILQDDFIGVHPIPVEIVKILYYTKKIEKNRVTIKLILVDKREVVLKVNLANASILEDYLSKHQAVSSPAL